MAKKESTVQAVRNYAAVNFTVTKKQVRECLNLTVDQAACSFDTLLRQGYLRRTGHGVYQFVDQVEKPAVEISDKIWRAMKVSNAFTAPEVAKLAESSAAYVYKRFRKYAAEGYIKRSGIKKNAQGTHERLWRLTPAGKKKAQNPKVEAWSPDPMVRAAVNLNRLVCSGVAVRDKESATEAMAQLTVIQARLEEVMEEK